MDRLKGRWEHTNQETKRAVWSSSIQHHRPAGPNLPSASTINAMTRPVAGVAAGGGWRQCDASRACGFACMLAVWRITARCLARGRSAAKPRPSQPASRPAPDQPGQAGPGARARHGTAAPRFVLVCERDPAGQLEGVAAADHLAKGGKARTSARLQRTSAHVSTRQHVGHDDWPTPQPRAW